MAREDRFWSVLAACFAAWMLVLQSVAGALAIGAAPDAASAANHDAFGNVLCIGDVVDASAGATGDADHRSCCALGCMLGVAAAVPVPAGSALDAPLAGTAIRFADAEGYRKPGSAQPGTVRSRAPPLPA